MDVRRAFIETDDNVGFKYGVFLNKWTNYLLNNDGELDFSHMEARKSVHLARSSYPHWQGLNWKRPATTSASLDNFFE